MQIRFAVLAAAALLAAPVAAQGGGAGGGGRPGGGAGGAARGGGFMAPAPDADQLVKQLKLSDESAAKVAKLVEAYKAETKGPQAWVDGIRASGDMQAMRSAPGAQDSLAKLMQSIGVRTVKADSASTLLQFSSGALDAMYSSPLFVAALWSQYKRVVTHMTAFRVAPFFGAIVINRRSWDRIPDSLKPALREAAERVSKEIGDEAVRLEEEGIAAMKRGGLIVPAYDASDVKAWDVLYAERMREVISSWYSPAFSAAIYAALGK
ncbi:MAG: hypothetical protein CVV51_03125 [Spirochaetae bacterium HGW-Spirochaetae-7]|nr:MAG: hypothetical protein CVV51_03125 [Spirochaetae bacterium HGW-Spirochaetae-7]